MDKILVVATRNNSPISAITKTFSDQGLMQKYIELKTNAGYHCHKFNYEATFTKESRITQTTEPKEV
jgi:hypothetical protein